MITLRPTSTHASTWQMQLREAYRDIRLLLAELGLDPADPALALGDGAGFPVLVPRSFASRMRPGDPYDPLLRQVLPVRAEGEPWPGFGLDPVGDGAARAATGVIHKYQGRALLISTGSCAIHCRYCFRRHFPYAAETAASAQWADALRYLRAHPEVEEVLLSGGDPLSLATHKLAQLSEGLVGLPTLRRLRIHTRWPVVLPARVDAPLLKWLGTLPWAVVMVLHVNHARELDCPSVHAALLALRRAGVSLLNQAVLLRGINDSAAAQLELSRSLGDLGVMPYYLHLLDRVEGAGHFEVSEHEGRELIDTLRRELPGYLVPRLARESAGAPSKHVLA